MAAARIARTPAWRSSARAGSPTGSTRTAAMTDASRARGAVVSNRRPPLMTSRVSPLQARPHVSTIAPDARKVCCYARHHFIHLPEPGPGDADELDVLSYRQYLCLLNTE